MSSNEEEYADDYEDDDSAKAEDEPENDDKENINDSSRNHEPLHTRDASNEDINARSNKKIQRTQSSQEPESFTNEFELKRRLYDTGKLLVTEGEKNISLALDLEKVTNTLKKSNAENDRIRLALLSGINGGIYDAENHSNIPLTELLRIRLQEIEDGGLESISLNHSIACSKKKVNGISGHMKTTRDANRKLQKLEAKRSNPSNGSTNDSTCTNRLRMSIHKMSDRSRRDRELKQKLQKQAQEANSKVDALSDHIEKLMVHLKHEAISKVKVLMERGKYLKEIEFLKKRNQIMENQNSRKDRAVNDLKEGGTLLEDQLSLMDEKYMELRMKLDWTRTQTEKFLKKKDDELKDLRLQGLISEKNGVKRSRGQAL